MVVPGNCQTQYMRKDGCLATCLGNNSVINLRNSQSLAAVSNPLLCCTLAGEPAPVASANATWQLPAVCLAGAAYAVAGRSHMRLQPPEEGRSRHQG